MTTYGLDDRLKENRAALTTFWRNLTLEQLGLMFAIVAMLIVFFGYLNQHMNVWASVGWLTNLFGDFYANVSSELISIVITVLILDRLNARRDAQERKLALFRQVKSKSTDVALEALDQILHDDLWDALIEHYQNADGRVNLSQVQWSSGILLNAVNLKNANLVDVNFEGIHLNDSNLESADLCNSKLKGAFLTHSNLKEATLWQTNLDNANLHFANLENADLQDSSLRSANLPNAHLQGAILSFANLDDVYLQNANLENANLNGSQLIDANLEAVNLKNANLQYAKFNNANLSYANLENANLQFADFGNANLQFVRLRGAKNIQHANFNEDIMLPDAGYIVSAEGKLIYDKYWTPDTDMTRYTNPDHPDFWEPEWVKAQREGN